MADRDLDQNEELENQNTGTDDQNDQGGDPGYLAMSDEDIMKMGAPVEAPAAAAVAAEAKPEDTDPDANANPEGEDGEGDGKAAVAAPSEASGAADDAAAVDPKPEGSKDEGKEVDLTAKDPLADGKDTKAKPVEKTEQAIDYEAEFKRLIGTPFKANGRDVVARDVDDAIALMQMGANYNKKMAALKPNLKLLKTLENHGLLSEEKISFLIDLSRKDPAAINKLVADSKIDPMDLSADKASEYKQTTYAVDDREIELDTVLDELQGSEGYNRTLEIVGNKWDGASKQAIAAQPELLKVLNSHVERGIYDIISAELENERMLGRLKGMSDLAAYQFVGDRINARGGFDHLASAGAPAARADAKPAVGTVVPPPKPKADEAALKDKRRAASSTKPVAPTAPAATDFNPLHMSDEEFLKVATPKYS